MPIQQQITGASLIDRAGFWLSSLPGSSREEASLFLSLGPEAPDLVTWAKKSKDGRLRINSGSLNDFARIADSAPIVFVPGIDVFLTEVKIPRGKRSRAVQSVPYLIEEDLAEDVESLHFSFGNENQAGNTEVAVVSRNKMSEWLSLLSKAGVEARSLIPGVLAVPELEGKCAVVAFGGEYLVRMSGGVPFAVDRENLALLISLKEGLDEGAQSSPIVFFAAEDQGREWSQIFPGREIELVASPFLQAMVQGYSPSTAIDLLQGQYSKSAEWRSIWQCYQQYLWLLLVLLGIGVVSFAMDYFLLKATDERLDAEMRAVFLEVFPDSKRTDNPRMRMESRLKESRLEESRRDVFFRIYDQAVPVMGRSSGARALTMSFKDGRFDFDMEIESLQKLDELKEKIGRKEGLKAEIRNASAAEDKVRAILQVMAK